LPHGCHPRLDVAGIHDRDITASSHVGACNGRGGYGSGAHRSTAKSASATVRIGTTGAQCCGYRRCTYGKIRPLLPCSKHGRFPFGFAFQPTDLAGPFDIGQEVNGCAHLPFLRADGFSNLRMNFLRALAKSEKEINSVTSFVKIAAQQLTCAQHLTSAVAHQ
jgi:hypothetical protein